MIRDGPLLAHLSLAEIERACHRETARYRRREPSDGRFCLEIFRRALERSDGERRGFSDNAASEVLVRIYTEFIKAQINRAALHSSALEDLVQQVWLRFWRAATTGLEFPSLEAALSYLKLTVVCAVIENQRRTRKQWRLESLEQRIELSGEEGLADHGAEPFSQHARQRFRERCREVLTDPLEHFIFWRRYSMGFAPREIASALASEGVLIKGKSATARAVSDLLDQCFKRLEDDPEIQDLLRND